MREILDQLKIQVKEAMISTDIKFEFTIIYKVGEGIFNYIYEIHLSYCYKGNYKRK